MAAARRLQRTRITASVKRLILCLRKRRSLSLHGRTKTASRDTAPLAEATDDQSTCLLLGKYLLPRQKALTILIFHVTESSLPGIKLQDGVY